MSASPEAWRGWKGWLAASLAGALLGGGAVALSTRRSVPDYLLENPEIIPQAMQKLQEKEARKAVLAHRARLETPFAGAWAGARDADVVLVEFFDYACGFCRRSNADVDRLLREDPRLKVVWREWPVLGPDSEAAARVSLAAAAAGRFKPFHDRLFAAGRPSAAAVADAQRAVAIPDAAVARLRAASVAEKEVGANHEMAAAIGATGTPTFVVGDRVLQGAVGYEALKSAVAEARSRKG